MHVINSVHVFSWSDCCSREEKRKCGSVEMERTFSHALVCNEVCASAMAAQWCYSMRTGFGPVRSVVLLELSHPQPLHRNGHPCTVDVNRDPRVCRDVQGDLMTQHQLVPVRPFAVSLQQLRTRHVDTVATWEMGVIMCFRP